MGGLQLRKFEKRPSVGACVALFAAFSLLPLGAIARTDVDAANPALAALSGRERTLFDAANRERRERRLRPLKWDAVLAAAARRHAILMADRDELSHQFPEEPALPARAQAAGVKFSSVAENIAYGPSTSAIHTGWMHSPHHRANLLDAESDSVGIAVVEHDGTLFAVEDFARAVLVVSLHQQIREVGMLLSVRGLRLVNDTGEAEAACRSGQLGESQQAVYLASYTTAELSRLPDPLIREIRTGRYHSAAVAACAPEKSSFTDYQIAVLLYP